MGGGYFFGWRIPVMFTRMAFPTLIVNRQRQIYKQTSVSDRFVQLFKADIQRSHNADSVAVDIRHL